MPQSLLEREIETVIDRHGLAILLDTISTICLDKAEHIRTNWQDERLARRWEAVSRRIGRHFRAGDLP